MNARGELGAALKEDVKPITDAVKRVMMLFDELKTAAGEDV